MVWCGNRDPERSRNMVARRQEPQARTKSIFTSDTASGCTGSEASAITIGDKGF